MEETVDHRLRTPAPESLAGHLPEGFEPEVAIRSDLNGEGRYGVSWVGADRERIVALGTPDGSAEIALSSVTEIRVDELFGASQLTAVQGDSERVVVRYSRNLVAEFGAFARALDDLREGRAVLLPEKIESAVCPRCGAPLPERGGSCSRCVSRTRVLLRVLRLLRPYRRQVWAVTLWAALGVGAEMVPPLTYKAIADQVIQNQQHQDLIFWIGLMAGAFAFKAGAVFMTGWGSAWLGARLVADMRLALHARAQRLQLGYHDRHESGALVSRVMGDTQSLQFFLIDGVPFFLLNLLSFVTIAVILFVLNWKLALLVLVPVPALVLGGGGFWTYLRPLFYKYGNRRGRLHTVLSESMLGIRAVKSLAQEKRRDGEFGRRNEQLRGVITTIEQTYQGFTGSMALMMAVGIVLVWYAGSHAIIDNQEGMSLGTLLAFVGYMALLYGPLQWFSVMLNRATTALTAAERIFSVLDQPEERARARSTSHPRVKGAIRFERVRFSYERGHEILKGIDLEINAGEMIGLVGRSGAGKSTIISLIARFHDPDSGAIYVDGSDLKDMDLARWRSQVGMVMQAPFLFNASILENIRYGTPDASFAEVVEAARAANAHDFISAKEDGYDTLVGDGGSSLSGGERQRVPIARAILHDPAVLILDEATSSVDSETEHKIQEAFARLVQGRTTIAIAHRLATLRNADRLIVIEDGQIVEQGTHEQLMALDGGQFAKLVKLQTDINRLRAEQSVYREG